MTPHSFRSLKWIVVLAVLSTALGPIVRPPVAAQSTLTEVFSDNFSSDPNTNGKWTVFRNSPSDTDNEISWDAAAQALYLTRAVPDRGVAVFANYQLTAKQWEAQFKYRAGGGSGGDGLVFMFYKNIVPYGQPGIPGVGGTLGFQADGCSSNIAGYGIEFDSYQNSECGEPPAKHIAVIKDTISNHLTFVSDPRTADDTWHNALVQFDNGRVVVQIDGGVVIDFTITNPDYTFSGVGFGAGTGLATNNHIIDDFVLRVGEGETPPLNTDFISPTAFTNDDGNWQNGPNAFADDNLFAESSFKNDKAGRWYGYTANIPADATIAGIEVRVDASVAVGVGWLEVEVSNGTTFSSAKRVPCCFGSTTPLTTSKQTYIVGSPTDLWGLTWNPAGANAIQVRVRVVDLNDVHRLWWIPVKIYYTFPAPPHQPCVLANFGDPIRQDVGTWAGKPYGGKYVNGVLINFKSNQVRGLGTDNIADWGCALTSYVMVINYVAVRQGISFHTDPEALNDWLQQYNGYSTGDVISSPTYGQYYDGSTVLPPKVEEYALTKGIKLHFSIGTITTKDKIDKELCNLRPVILAVNNAGHYVVTTGREQTLNTWFINDPLKSNTTTLQEAYNGQYQAEGTTSVSFEAPEGHIRVIRHSPVELLITDSQGRRTGLDPTSGIRFAEIPLSLYGIESLGSDNGNGGSIQNAFLDIDKPINGVYTLEATGTASGSYSLDILTVDNVGHGTLVTISGLAAPGATDTYFIGYISAPTQPVSIQRKVQVDIKPGGSPNSINLGDKGVVPVAVLSTSTFDATKIDPATITLAGAPVAKDSKGKLLASFKDVSGDGRIDLVVQVSTQALQLSQADLQATLRGRTFDGLAIIGVDSVTIIPKATAPQFQPPGK